jgi:hypothetical protein
MIEPRAEQMNAMGGCAPCQNKPPASPPPPDTPGASTAVGPSVVTVDPKKKEWLGIELKGGSGKPVPGAAWHVTLPNGDPVEGRLDANGKTRLEGLDPGQCTVKFPELDRRGFK